MALDKFSGNGIDGEIVGDGVKIGSGDGPPVGINVGKLEGGATLDNKLPPGTVDKETLGDGSSDADEDILLRDSETNINNKVFTINKGWICESI